MAFQLPDLPFAKDALGDVMSAETFDYHHGKHHKAYVDKTNGMLGEKGLEGASLVEVIKAAKDKGDKGLFNNSAQIWNHSFFWQCLAPEGSTSPSGKLKDNDRRDFGDHATLVDKLATESANHFASGWGWLVLNNGKLEVTSLHDADTPVVHGMTPAADARCVGTCLLHRLSQRAAALPQDGARQGRQLGLRCKEP